MPRYGPGGTIRPSRQTSTGDVRREYADRDSAYHSCLFEAESPATEGTLRTTAIPKARSSGWMASPGRESRLSRRRSQTTITLRNSWAPRFLLSGRRRQLQRRSHIPHHCFPALRIHPAFGEHVSEAMRKDIDLQSLCHQCSSRR